MKFQSSQPIPFPVDEVFVLVRDGLQDLVPYLPNVVKIVTESREESGGGKVLRVCNRWYGRADIPKAVARLVSPEKIAWLDTAVWDSADKSCRWEIQPMFFRENVTCSGVNRYVAEGSGTRLEIAGDLQVQTRGVPGVPRILAGKISGQVEKFIVKLLTPNLDSLATGVTRFLESKR